MGPERRPFRPATRPARRPARKTDSLTIKLVVAILFGACFVSTSAFIRNDMRNLTEDISRAEDQNGRLRRDFVAERGQWTHCSHKQNLSDMLADRGISMDIPSAEQIVLLSPAHDRHAAPVGIQAPSAVASR